VSSDNSSVPGRQASLGVYDYAYEYDYDATLDDEATMFDVERLDIEYVDDIALAAAAGRQLGEPDEGLELDDDNPLQPAQGSHHRRRRPHARCVYDWGLLVSLMSGEGQIVYEYDMQLMNRPPCFRPHVTQNISL